MPSPMPPKLLHEHPEFRELLEIVSSQQGISEPSLIEKDYWLMHVLYGLTKQGFQFQLKGGTSLSKGYQVIHRFSEDIDIRIDPPGDMKVASPNQTEERHIKSREAYFEWLASNISIPGVVKVARDKDYDDPKLRNAGIRLHYESTFGSIAGLKDGILLEVGFDNTNPHTPLDISSWAYDHALKTKVEVIDNRAIGIKCYNPEYTFVEKLQAIVKKYRQFTERSEFPRNFLRHYYDIHQLLDLPSVQTFIGTPKYEEWKKIRFRSDNTKVSESDAFKLSDKAVREQFEKEYAKTANLYYKGQIPLATILERIQRDLERL
jgi:predicted nucleotidyltransferase component of viral defense system